MDPWSESPSRRTLNEDTSPDEIYAAVRLLSPAGSGLAATTVRSAETNRRHGDW